ncbi:MAG: hypothetical protein H6618_06780 [Deltaproteobacteria bacterium]|nr:hypothetical protein [Deltaproteobacteria bacterium]
MALPSTNGLHRDQKGRFLRGNAGGPGNPHVAKVAKLRQAFLSAVSEDDIKKIVRAMVKAAASGDVGAARYLTSYLIGQPAELESDIQREIDRESFDLLSLIPREKLVEVARRQWQKSLNG